MRYEKFVSELPDFRGFGYFFVKMGKISLYLIDYFLEICYTILRGNEKSARMRTRASVKEKKL